MYFAVLPQQIWFIAMILVSGAALWRGGIPEKRVAVANVAAWFLTPLAYDRDLAGLQWGVLGVDALFLAYLLFLALTTTACGCCSPPPSSFSASSPMWPWGWTRAFRPCPIAGVW